MNQEQNQEGVRSWYNRTTKRTRKALAFATVVSAALAVVLFALAPQRLIAAAQIFNGAITIPAAGAIWIAAFLYMYLIPGREVSFRSQESLERTEARVQDAIDNKLYPAIGTWKRLGDRIEGEISSGLVDELRAAIKEVRVLAKNLDDRTKSLERDVRPAIAEIRDAIIEIQAYVAPKPQPPINLQRTLETLRKSRPVEVKHGNGTS